MNGSNTISRWIQVEHIRIESTKSIDEVRRTLESVLPQRDTTVSEALERGNKERVEYEREHGPQLALFLTRGHGRLLAIYGHARKAYQYEIGNPITAASMTQHRLAAALYAPLRVALYEDDHGRGVFEYDRPSSLFGQFDDERVTEVARTLDESLKQVLECATR